MEINDLRVFVAVARGNSLQQASQELHQTPSALSKALKRLEGALRAPLFDRAGKGLRLNDAGARLQPRALALLQLAEQTRSEFAGQAFAVDARVAAPALLLARFAPQLAAALDGADSRLRLMELFEAEALAALQRGEVDFALVSAAALDAGALPDDLQALPLEPLPMQLALSSTHPLAGRRSARAAEVLAHDFVCPQHSLLCGLRRGQGSDGWRDDQLPRRIRYRTQGLHALLTLVRAGLALAYLPSFLIEQEGLQSLRVSDCPFQCQEQALLLWRPADAAGWQARWVQALCGRATVGPRQSRP